MAYPPSLIVRQTDVPPCGGSVKFVGWMPVLAWSSFPLPPKKRVNTDYPSTGATGWYFRDPKTAHASWALELILK
jgi:hypothetical protein